MKKINSNLIRLALAAFSLTCSFGMMAQTTIPVGASQTYKTIATAYSTGIPATLTGAYIIELQSDYDPTGETYPITLGSKTSASATNTITIKPATGVSKTITPTLTGSTTTAPATFVDNSVLNKTTNSFYSSSLPALAVGDIISGNGLSATGVKVSSVSNGIVTVTGISNSLTPIQLTTANAVGASWLATNSTGTIVKITNATITSSSKSVTLAAAPSGITLVSGMLVGGDGIPAGTTIDVVTDQQTFTITNAATTAGTTLFFTDATAGKSLSPLAFQVPVGSTNAFTIGTAVSGTGIPGGATVSATDGNNIYITAASITSANFTYAQGAVVSANGSTNTSVGTLVLSGASYVTIDGGSKTNLIISNPFPDQSTIKFTGASNNTITNCTVKGCGKDATYANILIGASNQTAPCNSNTISYCDICDGTARPTHGVYILGAASPNNNNGNKVIYNNVFNIATVGNNVSFASIRMGNAADINTTIENNKIYWTSDINYGPFYNYQYGIISRGNSSVRNNIIGYKSSDSNPADIIKFTSVNVGRFYGIKIEGGTTSSHTVVSGNKIANLQLETRSTNSGDVVLSGILTYNTASTYIDIDNNTIENLKLYNNGNPNDITSTAINFAGIYDLTPNSTVTNNTLRNIEVHSGTSTSLAGYKSPVRGIYVYETAASTSSITGNKVYGLSSGDATNTGTTVDAYAIYCGATNVDKIEKNLVYDITAQNSTQTAVTYGIYSNYSSSTSTTPTIVKNNVVRLGTNMSTGNIIHGIYQKESATGTGFKYNVYNNSVYIGGTIASGATGITSAFTRAISATGKLAELKNNILVNVRSGGTTGKHYAVNLANATDYSSSYLASDNNLFQISTSSNNVFGIVGTTDIADFATWKSTCTGFDAASFNSDPQFNGPTASTPDLSVNINGLSDANNHGVTIATVTDDYNGITRTGKYDIGAYFINSDVTTAVEKTTNTDMLVYSNNGSIIINKCNNKQISIYSLSGILLKTSIALTDKVSIPMEKGLYITKIDSTVTKVLVK